MLGRNSPVLRSVPLPGAESGGRGNDDGMLAAADAAVPPAIDIQGLVDKAVSQASSEISDLRKHINFLTEENRRLRSQLVAAAGDCDEFTSPERGGVRKPPRKVAKKTSSDSTSSGLLSGDGFPVLPAVRRAVSNSNAASANRFAPLDDDDENMAGAVGGASYNAPSSKSNGSGVSGAGAAAKLNRKKVFQAIDTNLFNVCRQLKGAKVSGFTVKQAKISGPVKITISNEGEVSRAKSALIGAKVSFHEFKWSNEKQKCFIIRGLVGASEDELVDFKKELCDAGLPSDIVLSLHRTGFMRANPGGNHDAPVKLLLPPGADAAILRSIRYVGHIAVRFELFKSKSVVQCKNCQRFGHSAGGCQHAHRCVKCGDNHLREDCPRTLDPEVKLVCCNCGGEHTANNLNECGFFQRNYAKRPQQAPASQPAAIPGASAPSAIRKAGISFAQVARNSVTGARVSSGSTFAGLRNSSLETTESATMLSNRVNDFEARINSFDNQLSAIAGAIDELSGHQENIMKLLNKHDKILSILLTKFVDE